MAIFISIICNSKKSMKCLYGASTLRIMAIKKTQGNNYNFLSIVEAFRIYKVEFMIVS